MKNCKLILVLSLTISLNTLAAGSGSANSGTTVVTNTVSIPTTTSSTPVGTAPTGTHTSAIQTQQGNNQGSQVASYISTGLSIASAAFFAQAAATYGGCTPCVVKGAIAAAFSIVASNQSSANSNTAGLANGTGISTDGFGNGDNSYNAGLNGADLSKMFGGDLKNGQATMQKITTTGIGGYKVDPKTGAVTTPDGKVIPPSAFSSPEAMQAAGFSAADANGAFDKAKRLEAEAVKKLGIGGFDESGGGGASLSAASANASGTDQVSYSGASKVSSVARNPAGATGVAGLSKNFNGELIGVAEDNIFNMMSRRYKLKEKQDSFFSEAELIKK